MTDPIETLLTQYRNQAQAAGGTAWVEELLIRGGPAGIRGAHLIVGWQAPGVGGAVVSNVSNPVPVTMETDDPTWKQIKTEINAPLVQQVIDLQAEQQALQDDLLAAQSQIGELQQQLASPIGN